MSSEAKDKIKSLQSVIVEKAQSHPLHSPEVVKISQEVDEYVIRAMKKINKISN